MCARQRRSQLYHRLVETSGLIAIWALGVGGISLLWQIGSQVATSIRGRRRLVLTATAGSQTVERDGVLWSEPLVFVVAHAIRGPVGLKDVSFEWNPKASNGASWGALAPTPGTPTLNLSASHPPLQTGETANWMFRLGAGTEPGVDIAHQVRAVATQFDARRLVKSGPVFVLRDHRVGPAWHRDVLAAMLAWEGTVTPWVGDDAAEPEPVVAGVKRRLRRVFKRRARS